MRILKTLSPLILVLLFASCTSKSKDAGKAQKSSQFQSSNIKTVVMGDPLKVIEGAEFHPHVDEEFFKDTDELGSVSELRFVEKMSVLQKVLSKEEVEEAQKPSSPDYVYPVTSVKVKVVKDDEGHLIVELKSDDFHLTISNRTIDGKYYGYTLINRTNYSFEILHFSVSKDRQNMSLLYLMETTQGQSVVAHYFTKRMKAEEPERIGQYNYMRGLGIKTVWSKDRPIPLEICGHAAGRIESSILYSVNKWNEILKPKQKIALKEADSYFPFSDLNQQCIYLVDNYLYDPSESEAILGIAILTDFGTNEFVDGDIVIFNLEYGKKPEYHRDAFYLRRAIQHEIGHFLGLQHQFDGTPSIMSYNFSDHPGISNYDKIAIRHLYQ